MYPRLAGQHRGVAAPQRLREQARSAWTVLKRRRTLRRHTCPVQQVHRAALLVKVHVTVDGGGLDQIPGHAAGDVVGYVAVRWLVGAATHRPSIPRSPPADGGGRHIDPNGGRRCHQIAPTPP